MNVNIEVQYLCIKQEYVRGIPYYIKHLVETLAFSESNKYAVSFFDFNKERNNRDYVLRYIEKKALERISLNECNTLSYKEFFEGYRNNTSASYDHKSYEDYVSRLVFKDL